MTLKTRLQSQRDARWGSILLGFNTDSRYTLYSYGCLITSLANYIDKQPDEVNTLLKNNAGFTTGSGYFIWSKCSILGLKEQYISTRCQAVSLYKTEVDKLIGYLGLGYPALCEVDFNPSTDSEEMHYVLAVGYNDGEIMVVDPWEGQLETWTFEAFQRNTYQYRVYDKKLVEDGSGGTVAVDTTTFEKLVANSTTRDQIRDKFNCSDNNSIILAEADKLMGLEQTVSNKDKEIETQKAQIVDLETKLLALQNTNAKLQLDNDVIQTTVTNQTKLITSQDASIVDLQSDIETLKKQITTKVYSGWKKALIALIDKL